MECPGLGIATLVKKLTELSKQFYLKDNINSKWSYSIMENDNWYCDSNINNIAIIKTNKKQCTF